MSSVEFRPILVRIGDIAGPILAQVNRAMDRAERTVLELFGRTTATWDTKVPFKADRGMRGGDLISRVGTSKQPYPYVDWGTRPHVIRPTNAPYLVFQEGYKPKTTPGYLGSEGGGSWGSLVFSRGVNHPGTEPRKFSEQVNESVKRPFVHEIQEGIRNAFKGAVQQG